MLNQLEGEYYGKDNVFYRKIDLENIAITGHSQGGYGVVNAIANQKHKENYKAAAILSLLRLTKITISSGKPIPLSFGRPQ